MKVYKHGTKDRNAIVFVEPGVDIPDNPFFFVKENDGKGKMVDRPKQFAVKFEEGCAQVDERVGRYMIDREMAKPSPIAEPEIEVPPQFNTIKPQQITFT